MALIKRVMPVVLLLLIAAPFLRADDETESPADETGSRVLIQSSPDNPAAGTLWTLTLLIDHNEPEEVDVLAPHLGDSLFLEQVLKQPRAVNTDERWTAMEYRFVLGSPGIIEFEAFTVITPEGQTITKPFELIIEEPQITDAVQVLKFAWERIPSGLKTGEEAFFVLRYSGSNPIYPQPTAELFMPPVPPGHILESVRLSGEERPASIALKLRLIPLEAVPFVLAKRQFTHNGIVYEIPSLRIAVSASEKTPSSKMTPTPQVAASPSVSASSSMSRERIRLLFPTPTAAIQGHSALYQKHRADCETIYTQAKNLWEKEHFAYALAALRKNERDHAAGAFFAVIRREAERAFGLSGTKDEEKRSFMPFWGEKRRSAVLVRMTAIRQIPDRSGEEIALLGEGHPVLLNGKPSSQRSQKWLQVTTNDDNRISGWVPEENIIIY